MMIDLTPLEVRQKKDDFPRGLRGYDPGHVDDFLNLVAERLEALVKENRRLAEEVGTLRAGAGEYRDREKALTEALVSAQQMRESVREQSTREADLVRREAEHDAQRLRNDALLAIEREEETLRRLRARQRQLVEGYRGMLERELRELAVVAASLDAGEAASVPAVAGVGPVEAGAGSAAGGKAAGAAPGAAGQAGGAKPVEAGKRGEPGPRERAGTGGPAGPEATGTTAAGVGVDDAAAAVGDAAAAVGDAGAGVGEDDAGAGEDEGERRTPWAVPPPAAPRPAGDRRGHGRDRFAPPAASMEGTEPRRGAPDPAARGEDAQPGRAGGDEPDWLAAILKEE